MMEKLALVVAGGTLALSAHIPLAFADTIIAAPPSTTTVAIGNGVAVVLTACVAPVAALTAGALWALWTKLGFQATAADKANLESELQTSLAFGVAKAIPALKEHGWDNVDVHSQIIADAANFALQRYPGRTAKINTAANSNPAVMTPGTITPLEAVSDSLTARLPEALTIAAASPVTPPAPLPFAPAPIPPPAALVAA